MDRYVVWFSKNLLIISLIGIAAFSFNLFSYRDESVLLYDYKRIFSCFIVILSSSCLIVSEAARSSVIANLRSLSGSTLVIVALLLLFSFYANLTGFYKIRGLFDLMHFLGLLLLATSISRVRPNKYVYELLNLIIILCYLSVLLGFIVSILYGDGESIWTILSYANPRFLNQVQVWLFVPCLFVALHFNKTKYWIPFFLNYALVFALDARGLFIASTCGLILWSILDKKLRKRILNALVLGVIFGYLTKWVTLEPFPAYLITGELGQSGLSVRTTDSGRLFLWDFALTNLSFWGHGGDAFACNSPLNARPHNSLVLVAFNWGIIPAVCYLTLIATMLLKLIKTNNAKMKMWGVSLLSGIAYSLVSGVLDSPLSQLLASLTLGLFWSTFSRKECKSNNILLNILVIVISLCVIFTTSIRVLDRVENKHFLTESYIPETYYPQFWLGNNCVGIQKKIE